MPMFVVNTNVAKGDVPHALLSEAIAELAKALGKPVQVGRKICFLHTIFVKPYGVRLQIRIWVSNASTNAFKSRI